MANEIWDQIENNDNSVWEKTSSLSISTCMPDYATQEKNLNRYPLNTQLNRKKRNKGDPPQKKTKQNQRLKTQK